MRLQNWPLLLLLVLLIVVAASIAQDTSFPTGPQYLITTENPMLLRPIATPSLNLSGETLAGTSEVPRPMELPASASVEKNVYLHDVYWGDHPPEESLRLRLETPSMTPDQTAWYMNYVTSQAAAIFQAPYPEAGEAATSFAPQLTSASEAIELTGGSMPTNLPATIFDPGVTGMTDPQSLEQRGYGVSLGEVAAYWKVHRRHAPRVFTNQDVHRK